MRKSVKLSWLVLLLPTICLADGIPSVNEVPMFWGMLNNNPRYHDAAFKAQEAFFLQTGISAHYNLIINYINDHANRVAKTIGTSTAKIIDENTPLKSRQVFFIVGMGYAAAIRKEVTKSFRNPFFPSVNHTVTVSQTRQVFGIQIPF